MGRVLFVKSALAWPRLSGHDVHSYYMMRALARRGHEISLATLVEPSPEALEGLTLHHRVRLAVGAAPDGCVRLSTLQAKFSSYYGVDTRTIADVAQLAQARRADAVVAVGLEVLPLLAAVEGASRIWYAADEWVWHHLSQVQLRSPATWREFAQAAWKGLYERAFASVVDRVWVVSVTERRAMRWLAGMPHADIITNGVDADFYHPSSTAEIANSAIFWGRLDFGPNVQALQWFCGHVWPAVRRDVPDAQFTIAGFNPNAAVRALADGAGVTLRSNVDDLRPEISRHALAVLPLVSGGGIKNKLLEAASLGKAIVCTPRACVGLTHPHEAPLVQATSVSAWRQRMQQLWSDDQQRRCLGVAARQWVRDTHSWDAAARAATAAIEGCTREVHA